MKMPICSRCHKRVAVVFVAKKEDKNMQQMGLCIQCAKELGIKPINEMMAQLNISEQELTEMTAQLEEMVGDDLSEILGGEGFGGLEALNDLNDADNDAEDAQEDGNAEKTDKNSTDENDGEHTGTSPSVGFAKLFENLSFPLPSHGQKGQDKASKKAKNKKEDNRKTLNTYCQNLTKKASDGKLDDIVGRSRELARVVQILCRRQKNNPCLIGEPGVGKTAIAEALAQKIVNGDIPYKLKNTEVYLVDLTALVAGTQFRGQFEARMLGLIKEVKEAGNIILVIDEVHNIVGTGAAEGSMNAANILKPALSRGEIQVIGATTLEEYRKYIEKDTALERRFQPVLVEEPTLEDCDAMIKGIKKYYETYHDVQIPERVAYTAIRLSERYINDRFLPDKAIDLIDEAAAQKSLSSPVINEKRRLDEELKGLGARKTEAENITDDTDEKREEKYKVLADLRVEELRLLERIAVLEKEIAEITLTVSDMAKVIEIWTGIPADSITANEFEKLDVLETSLQKKIVGQDEAVSAVVRAIKRKRAGVSYRRAPVSFIFAGPTGVGKTELVKVLAEELFGKSETLIRLDMSEFMEKHSVSKIVGAPPGYVGYDDAGQLTEKIRRHPYSVVLFDEIEKAHPDVLNILLQILDDGRITDAKGKKVNFENTVIILTTNAGSNAANAISGFAETKTAAKQQKTEKALSSFLRPEFMNRIDEIITFNSLTTENFTAIATIMLEKLKKALAEKDITLTYSPKVAEKVASASFSEKYGARNMRRYIQTEIEDKIAEKLIASYQERIGRVAITTTEDGFAVKLKPFPKSEELKVLPQSVGD